ncbi:hypothetical protein [Mesorhizobium sp. BR1-1-13]|nr:hypothetical protein [Mesorhizobium sp. BR1-1-13]
MADIAIEAISTVVGRIYEAAYDQERWLAEPRSGDHVRDDC